MWSFVGKQIVMAAIPIGYYLVEIVAYTFVLMYEAFGMQYRHFEDLGTKPTMFGKTKNSFDISI